MGARSSCPAGPENWDNISLPKTRSDIPPAAGTMSKSCLGAVPAPQPALPRGYHPAVPLAAQPSSDDSCSTSEQSTAAATLPVTQKRSLYTVMQGGTITLGYCP